MKILTIKVFGDSGWQEYSLGVEELATQVASLESAVEKLELKEGPAGKDGQDGLSAYEIACQYGFEGSEEEWLDSLHGKDGVDGIDGNTPYIGENGNWWIGGEDTGVNAGGSGEGKCDCADTVDKLVDVVSNHETRIIALEEGDNDDTNLVTDMVYEDDRFVGAEVYSDGVFVSYRPDDTTYPGDLGTKAFFGFPYHPTKKEILATEDYVQDCIDNGHHVRIIEHTNGDFAPGKLEIYKDGFIVFDAGQATAEPGKILYLPEVSDSGESLVTKEYVVNNFAKLSGAQTFTGPKTFESNVFFNGMVRLNNSAGSVDGNVKNHVRLFKEGLRLYNSNTEYSFLYFPSPTDGNGTIATEEYVDEAISKVDIGGGSGHNGETIVITEGNGGSVNSAEYHSDGVLLNCEGEEFFLEFPTSKYENGILATEEYVQEQLKNIDPGIGGNFVTTDTTQSISGGKFITFSDSVMAGASDIRRVRLAKEGFRLYSATNPSNTALLYYPDVESGDGVIATREYVENYMKDQGFLDLPYEIETLDKRVSAIELGGGGGGSGAGALINLNGTYVAPGQTAQFYAPTISGDEDGLVLTSRHDGTPVWDSIQGVMAEKCSFEAVHFEASYEGGYDYDEGYGKFMFTVFGDFSTNSPSLDNGRTIVETLISNGIGGYMPAAGYWWSIDTDEYHTVYAIELDNDYIYLYTFGQKSGEYVFSVPVDAFGESFYVTTTYPLTTILS